MSTESGFGRDLGRQKQDVKTSEVITDPALLIQEMTQFRQLYDAKYSVGEEPDEDVDKKYKECEQKIKDSLLALLKTNSETATQVMRDAYSASVFAPRDLFELGLDEEDIKKLCEPFDADELKRMGLPDDMVKSLKEGI